MTPDSNSPSPEPLRSDRRGRVRTPRNRQAELLAEFDRSGVSGAEFARLAGIKYATFIGWVQKRRRTQAAAVPMSPPITAASPAGAARQPFRLVEAVVGQEACGGEWSAEHGPEAARLQIELPGGSRTTVGSPLQLRLAAELVGLLAQHLRLPC